MDTEVVDSSENEMSDEEDDEARFGFNPLRPERYNANAKELRAYLVKFTTEAEKIAGETYSAEQLSERCGKSIVLSDDLKVLEVSKDGIVTDVRK